jgi:hypothetical protein
MKQRGIEHTELRQVRSNGLIPTLKALKNGGQLPGLLYGFYNVLHTQTYLPM